MACERLVEVLRIHLPVPARRPCASVFVSYLVSQLIGHPYKSRNVWDVAPKDDACRVRKRASPRVLAAVTNATLTILRLLSGA